MKSFSFFYIFFRNDFFQFICNSFSFSALEEILAFTSVLSIFDLSTDADDELEEIIEEVEFEDEDTTASFPFLI